MSQPIRLDQIMLALAIMGFFAYLGYRRGVLRELVAAPAILAAPWVGPWLGVRLVPWVNRFYRLALFARYGGLTSDDLAAVMAKVKEVKPLITTPEHVATLGVIAFSVVIAAGYLLGQWKVKGPADDKVAKFMGAVIGAINGYMLARTVLPRLWSAQYAVVIIPTAGVMQLLHGQAAVVLVVAFIALVAYGLSLAGKKEKK